ncbi:hypothetical protein TorRG33x02_245250 [Trema orientale]|uniref:Uncharacterized protein n=1 Tax=Trema orientale TaxID=63057 RepID=A0A2P5DQ85_TREOI|nr:hypothetical protein TorRG33x02_245250 [Trema orientale]
MKEWLVSRWWPGVADPCCAKERKIEVGGKEKKREMRGSTMAERGSRVAERKKKRKGSVAANREGGREID